MIKRRLSELPAPVPWQGYEEFEWVASELFSCVPERTTNAYKKIADWELRGNMPVEVEISACLVAVHQQQSDFIHCVAGNAAFSQSALKMMLAMAIHGLVCTVVGQSPTPTRFSKKKSAETTGLPPVLLDIQSEAANGRVPNLSCLLSASKEALSWLQVNYWQEQMGKLRQASVTDVESRPRKIPSVAQAPRPENGDSDPVPTMRVPKPEPFPEEAAPEAKLPEKASSKVTLIPRHWEQLTDIQQGIFNGLSSPQLQMEYIVDVLINRKDELGPGNACLHSVLPRPRPSAKFSSASPILPKYCGTIKVKKPTSSGPDFITTQFKKYDKT